MLDMNERILMNFGVGTTVTSGKDDYFGGLLENGACNGASQTKHFWRGMPFWEQF